VKDSRASGQQSPIPWWKVLGPGIVSGASDNDPTTVASLAVIGSTTVYGLSWLVLLIIPMLSVVQAISAQVGLAANTGLEDAVRRRYGKGWASLALVSILIVNVITLAADLEGAVRRCRCWYASTIAGSLSRSLRVRDSCSSLAIIEKSNACSSTCRSCFWATAPRRFWRGRSGGTS